MSDSQGNLRRIHRLETLVEKQRAATLDNTMPRCIVQPRPLAQAEWIALHMAKDPDAYLEPAIVVWKALQRSLQSEPEYASDPLVHRARGFIQVNIEKLRKAMEG